MLYYKATAGCGVGMFVGMGDFVVISGIHEYHGVVGRYSGAVAHIDVRSVIRPRCSSCAERRCTVPRTWSALLCLQPSCEFFSITHVDCSSLKRSSHGRFMRRSSPTLA